MPLATVTWRKLDNLDQGELYFRRIRKAEPSHPALMEFYRDYHSRREIPQLLALFAQAQKAETDPEKRIRLGIEMAELAEQRRSRPRRPSTSGRACSSMRPGLPEAVTALRRLYTRTEKWNALLEMLKDDLEALPKEAVDEKIARYLEMIPIYRDRLQLDVMVTNTFAAILALRPDHPEALRALAERHEAQGRWADLIDVLQRQAAVTQAKPPRRCASTTADRRLWSEKLAKQQNAIAALEKILEIDPGERLPAVASGDLHPRPFLAAADRSHAARAPTPAARPARRAPGEDGRGCRRAARSRPRGHRHLERGAELDPRDGGALAALAKLYEKEGRWAALAEILAARPRWWARRRRWLRAQRAARPDPAGELGATATAEETLRKVHDHQPENPRGLRGDARDLRRHRQLHAPRGALRRARRLGRALRGAHRGRRALYRTARPGQAPHCAASPSPSKTARALLGAGHQGPRKIQSTAPAQPLDRQDRTLVLRCTGDTSVGAACYPLYEALLARRAGAPNR